MVSLFSFLLSFAAVVVVASNSNGGAFFSSLLSIFLVVLQWNSMNDFVVSEKENKNHNRAVIILFKYLFVRQSISNENFIETKHNWYKPMQRRGTEMKKKKSQSKMMARPNQVMLYVFF